LLSVSEERPAKFHLASVNDGQIIAK